MALIRPPEHPSSATTSLMILVVRLRKHKYHILPIVLLLVLAVRFVNVGDRLDYSSSSSTSTSTSFRSPKKDSDGHTLITCPQYKFPKRSSSQDQQSSTSISISSKWSQTARWVKEQGLTFLEEDGLQLHYDLLNNEIEQKGIPGMIVECGVAKAGSAISFAATKHPKRCLHLFDTYEGIPEPSAVKDGEDVQARYRKIQIDKQHCKEGLSSCNKDYYGNMDDLLSFDIQQFERAGYPAPSNNVYFHKGLFDDTVWPAGPIAYAHLDGDWYDSTYHMLQRISPFLSIGGYFVLDDVYQWSGAKNAYIDYFQVDLNWLQNQKQQGGSSNGSDGNDAAAAAAASNNNNKPSCWTKVVTTTTRGRKQQHETRYYRLVLDVRALAQAISATTVEQLEVPECVPPPPPPPPPSSMSTSSATGTGNIAPETSTSAAKMNHL